MIRKTPPRSPHAVMDLPSREMKAIKIERLLQLSAGSRPIRLLEIGTGSGGIAHYFATHPTLHCEVTAVDVVDQRLARGGYRFLEVEDTSLPFPDAGFDVVITNHVIEHVGDGLAQRHHLAEVYRVMQQDGVGYLAVPNRWQVVEPHYKLPFLSWLPPPLRSRYLRLMRRGDRYDCNPLSLKKLEDLLTETGFCFHSMGISAFREMLDIEGNKGALANVVATLPNRLLEPLAPIMPTLIYRLYNNTL